MRNSKTLNAGPGMMVRMPAPPAAGSDAETQALRQARADLARFAVAFLLTPPASMPLEFTYGGEAESPDGKADVVDVKGPGSFAARLFFDKSSHRPLMLVLSGRRAADGRADDERRSGAGSGRRGASRQRGAPPPSRRRPWTSRCSSTTTAGRRRHVAASRLAIDRRKADRGVDVQDDQGQPGVQAGHVLGEVGGA